jgi:hypothetical protein
MFEICVDYRAPSQEWLFLGNGWGVRDVRGPYLSASEAEIIIYNWALSRSSPSTLRLTLSLSSRAEVNALFVRARGEFGTSQCIVGKIKHSIMTISPLLGNDANYSTIIKLWSVFRPDENIPISQGRIDIVAIDKLQLTR